MRTKNKSGRQKARIIARAKLPTRFGEFTVYGVEGAAMPEGMVALVHGRLNGAGSPLVRIHSQCLTGDVLMSQRCDCRAQLEYSMRRIARAKSGVLLYVPQEGRGIGLMNKLRAYELQDRGRDTVEANRELGFADDSRDYSFCAAALRQFGVERVRLLSNNPDKVEQLEAAGVEVVERIPCQPRASRIARGYMRVKKEKMGHLLAGV
jgi:GTP cyclohydrolase II